MKAIFIDAENKTVEKIDFQGNYKDIQRKIKVSTFTCVGLNDDRDSLFVDDEGLINGTNYFFHIDGMTPHPLAGNGLILGLNSETGDSKDASCFDIFDANTVQFMDRMAVRRLVYENMT